MNTKPALSLLAFALLACPGVLTAQDAAQDETSFTAVIGGQSVSDVDLLGRARFEQYREVPEGAVFEFGRLEWQPADKPWLLSITAFDAFQKDERYHLDWTSPGSFSLELNHQGLPHYYASAATTLWSGVGTTSLTLSNSLRQPIETAAGSPLSPVASDSIQAVMDEALAASGQPLDLRTERRKTDGLLSFSVSEHLSLSLDGVYERRTGTKGLNVGTYVRRQALAGIPGTGAGKFWRETVEPRNHELVEPLDQTIIETGASLTWAKKGHSVVAGWKGSWFRNDATTLYFDNPFEGVPGRASATIYNPASDQEPAAPNGNNQFRGLYSRSAIQLWPENTFNQIFGNGSFKLGDTTRLVAALSYGKITQDDPFLPYAENDQVVFSGTAGQPGVVYARDAALPQASLDGAVNISRADLRLTSRPSDDLSLRAGYRLYDYDDQSSHISFPGYTSSSDSFFRRSIGQKDEQGQPALFNHVGGYKRQRLNAGVNYTFGSIALDGEYLRTQYDYDVRQVEKTAENALKASLRYLTDAGTMLNVHYLFATRDFDGEYDIGLERSGVRAYDVWTRDRNQFGADLAVPVGDALSLNAGLSYAKDEYPDGVEGFTYAYGLQDSRNTSVYAGVSYGNEWTLGAWAGFDSYEWNSLQVTKTSLTTDYNPTNRWTRESSDDVFWIGFDVRGPLGESATLRADVDYQQFTGDWVTTNLATPDINSAVAYPFPELEDSTLTARISVLWNLSSKLDIEARYWYEPYRLTDFTWDAIQPYPLGVLQETHSSPSDVADANVSRVLWLNNKYDDYTAHTLSAFLHLRF